MITAKESLTAQSSLLEFTKIMFKYEKNSHFRVNHHHETICDILEKVLIGKIKRLIINIPPRYSKTELSVVNFIPWSLGLFPDSHFIHTSYSHMLAGNNSFGAKNVVLSKTYQTIFPDVKLKQASRAKASWGTTKGGVIYATGTGGTITGYGAGRMREGFGGAIIIDDAHKADGIHSDIKRNAVLNWFSNTLESRTNSPETPIIIIGQRLHEEDICGFLLNGGNGEHWDLLMLPALNDNDEPLWEWKHNREDLRRLERSNPYTFSGQYMQSPSPIDGGMFKDEYWQHYDILPSGITDIKIFVDTAQKTAEHNDYSVLQCWGKAPKGIYLIDQVRGKWEAPQLERVVVEFWNKHKTKHPNPIGARSLNIEDKSSGSSLIQSIKQKYQIPVVAIQRSVDKYTRAFGAVTYFAAGFVWLPYDAEWLHDYKDEFRKFSPAMTHKHDDQIDPTIDAVEEFLIKKQNNLYSIEALGI